MPESDELAIDIKEIRWRQESMDGSMDLLLKANREAIIAEIGNFFGNSKRRAQVYLAVDGDRSVGEITQLLNMKMPNVSTDLSKCAEEGLIERIPVPSKGGFVWKKKRIDKVLHISEYLRKKFDL
jgi:DNA-binding transcriptional ArsR family regulator